MDGVTEHSFLPAGPAAVRVGVVASWAPEAQRRFLGEWSCRQAPRLAPSPAGRPD